MEDGQLYQLHEYARCDACRKWWRKHVEARYHVMNRAGDGLPYETGYGEHVRDLGEWERTKDAGSSFAVWTNYEWEAPESIKCPDCRAARLAAAAALTLDLDGDPAPEQPATEEEALDALVPAGFVEALDPRLGTAQVVAALKAAGVTRPKGAAWNLNRLANLCTFAALDLKYDRPSRILDEADPEPTGDQLALRRDGEQLALI